MSNDLQPQQLCPSCGASVQSVSVKCDTCGGSMVERSLSMSEADPGESSSSIIVDIEGDEYIGKVLNGRYRIDERLGVGGYGIVYKATYIENDTSVAIKMLRAAEDHNQEVRARFRREGEALSNLQNEHTVRTYEFNYDENGSMFIAMELLHGQTLKDELRKLGSLPWRRTLDILMQICEALTEAHASGYVHRDLKPENIYLCHREGDEDMVKVLDFGIAKKLAFGAEGETQLTAHGQTVGTMRYMSPEQLLGQPVDSRSDIYSLGVLTHRMLTGRVPFPKAKNMARLIAAQLQQAPKPPSVTKPKAEIPAAVDRLELLMLEKTAPARLPNTELLRMACQEILDTGDWSGADRYDRKSSKEDDEEDRTAPAEAVDPESIASMLSPEAKADLASIAGHASPTPGDDDASDVDVPVDVTERTAVVTAGSIEDVLAAERANMPNANNMHNVDISLSSGGSFAKLVLMALFFATIGGAVVYFIR